MSIFVAIFIMFHALKSFKTIIDVFLEKTPNGIKISELKEHLLKIDNVIDVHHIHIWSMDGFNNYATMHVVTELKDTKHIRNKIKEELKEHGISHTTIEIEEQDDNCNEVECTIDTSSIDEHRHHH